MELSEKIAMLRKALGLTQEQLAEKLFVSRTAVSKWETGRGMPGMDSLQQMAKFFGITLDERIADGYYYAKTIELFKYIMEHPEYLDRPANEEVVF